jgi:hypothetical protein
MRVERAPAHVVQVNWGSGGDSRAHECVAANNQLDRYVGPTLDLKCVTVYNDHTNHVRRLAEGG